MPLALPTKEDVLASLVHKTLRNFKGEANDVTWKQLYTLQCQVQGLVVGEQQPVHKHEDGREEEPNPKSLRRMKQQKHVDELPSHVHAPEQVETTQSASDAVGSSPGARHGRQQYGQHEEGQDDACQGRATVLKVEELLQQCHATCLLLGTQLPQLKRVKLDRGRRLDQIDVHTVPGNVDGCTEHGVAGNHDVESNGVINWNPLARGAHTAHGGLQALQGGQNQHGKVQVHAIAATLGDGIGPGLVEAAMQVGEETDHEDQNVQHCIHESGEPLLTDAASAEATVDGLKPCERLLRQGHVSGVHSSLLVYSMRIGLLCPFMPLLGHNLAPLLHQAVHCTSRQEKVEKPWTIPPGEQPTARTPTGIKGCYHVDHQDQAAEGTNAQGNVLIELELKACDLDGCLVRPVGKIIVPGASNVVVANMLHLHQTSIEVGRSSVELFAVRLRILVVRLRVASHNGVLLNNCCTREKTLLIAFTRFVQIQIAPNMRSRL